MNPGYLLEQRPLVGARHACDSHAWRAPTNAVYVAWGNLASPSLTLSQREREHLLAGSCPLRSDNVVEETKKELNP